MRRIEQRLVDFDAYSAYEIRFGKNQALRRTSPALHLTRLTFWSISCIMTLIYLSYRAPWASRGRLGIESTRQVPELYDCDSCQIIWGKPPLPFQRRRKMSIDILACQFWVIRTSFASRVKVDPSPPWFSRVKRVVNDSLDTACDGLMTEWWIRNSRDSTFVRNVNKNCTSTGKGHSITTIRLLLLLADRVFAMADHTAPRKKFPSSLIAFWNTMSRVSLFWSCQIRSWPFPCPNPSKYEFWLAQHPCMMRADAWLLGELPQLFSVLGKTWLKFAHRWKTLPFSRYRAIQASRFRGKPTNPPTHTVPWSLPEKKKGKKSEGKKPRATFLGVTKYLRLFFCFFCFYPGQ